MKTVVKKRKSRRRPAPMSKFQELTMRLKTMRETAADVNRDAEALFAARKALVVMVGRVLDMARALPGLYTTAADGRPAFTSQAAADFVNAINQCAALCTEADPKTNDVLRAMVIKEASEIAMLRDELHEERRISDKLYKRSDMAGAQVLALQKAVQEQKSTIIQMQRVIDDRKKAEEPEDIRQFRKTVAFQIQHITNERDHWMLEAKAANAKIDAMTRRDATEATVISAAMKLPGLYSVENGTIVYSSEQAATLVRAVSDYERSLNRTPWEHRILEAHGVPKPKGLLSRLRRNANKRRS